MIDMISNIGNGHSVRNEENQDAICFEENKRFSVIALADGVSTCRRAKEGATIASQSLVQLLSQKGDYFLEFEKNQIAENVLTHILYKLNEQSIAGENPIEEYSSTIAGALFDKKKNSLLYFSLGDSLILATGRDGCKVLAMPTNSINGCCVTTTQNAAGMIDAGIIKACDYNSVVICSDGAWREMYEKNRLKQEVARFIYHNEYEKLKDFLLAQNVFDDYSFISMSLCDNKNGVCA